MLRGWLLFAEFGERLEGEQLTHVREISNKAPFINEEEMPRSDNEALLL
jgi:hypothetical protein